MDGSQRSPEEQDQHLKECAAAAKHIANAAESMVFQMLSEGCLTADAISPTLGMGILVGPASFIQQAKAYVLANNGLMTKGEPMRLFSEAPSPSDEPCQN